MELYDPGFIALLDSEYLVHLSNSTDLAPSEFNHFPTLKKALRRNFFNANDKGERSRGTVH